MQMGGQVERYCAITNCAVQAVSFILRRERCIDINIYMTDERNDAADKKGVHSLQVFRAVIAAKAFRIRDNSVSFSGGS
ncbi:hypothetical protein DEU51_11480 [Pseudomonas jessenii]|uniref:Uncharacterized protein n=1 Tax=Pseudomonas jessenii TaxID=77298 RepID=A0A370S902_PSEJE|nr:hypothetical protein DEU51_11480 [Pseudomonas jessenii]